ncbi:MAG TPA: hypothetical protein PK595_06910 [Bacteroidota bacterium]|nr:hypothetical protein [Bacteroidota bacterium]
MASIAGIKQLLLCKKGTLLTDVTDEQLLGIRKDASLSITDFDTIEDFRGRKLHNKINFKAEAETFQPTMYLLNMLQQWVNGEVDVEIITEQQPGGGIECYQFEGETNPLGIEFEFLYTDKSRSCKLTLERALPYATGIAMLNAASSTSPVYSNPQTGENPSLYRMPLLGAWVSNGDPIYDPMMIQQRSLSIKTNSGKKTADNMSIVDRLIFKLEITGYDAALEKILGNFSSPWLSGLFYQEMNSDSTYDGFQFGSNVLHKTKEITIDKEQRIMKLTFEGSAALSELQFDIDAEHGASADDTDGTTGGTMNIAYDVVST